MDIDEKEIDNPFHNESEQQDQAILKQRVEQRWGAFLGLRRNAWLEILFFLLLVLAIDYFMFDGDRFATVSPHPFWIIILISSVQYGAGAGITATVLSSFLLLAGNMPEYDINQDLHQWILKGFALPLMWLATAVVIGELSARNIRERKDTALHLAETMNRLKLVSHSFEQLQGLRDRLEVRVAGQLRTVSNTWKAARAIEQLEPDQVMNGVNEMVTTLLEPEQFSLFLFKDNQLQMAIQEGWTEQDHYQSVFTDNDPLFQSIIADHKILSVSHQDEEAILDDQAIMAGPLINPDTGELIGMLKIESLGFSRMSVSTVENFNFICQWIGSVYGNAVKHEQSKAKQFFNSDDNLYSEVFFNRHKKFLGDLAERIGFDMTMISIRLKNYQQLPHQNRVQFAVFLGQAVEEILRDTDLAFNQQSEDWEFAIILPGTPIAGAEIVKTRLLEIMDSKVTTVDATFDYIFESVELHKDDKKRLDAPQKLIGNAFAESNNFYIKQMRFMTSLARRLNFPLTQLRVTCSKFRLLPEKVRLRFATMLGELLEKELRNTDETLNFQIDTGEFVLLLPGTAAEQVEIIQPRLQQAINRCIEDQKMSEQQAHCHFEIISLNAVKAEMPNNG